MPIQTWHKGCSAFRHIVEEISWNPPRQAYSHHRMNWIPRNLRWTETERRARETAARQQRESIRKLWLEKEEMRKTIEKEIQSIKQYRIKLLEF